MKVSGAAIWLLSGTLIVAGCSRDDDSPVSPIRASASNRSVAQTPGRHKTLDDEFDAMTDDVPGFGGAFKGGDGRTYVYHLTPEKAGLVDLVGSHLPASLANRPIQMLQGQYSFHNLKTWKEEGADVLNERGAAFIDADEVKNRVTVGIWDASAETRIRSRAEALGIPHDAINIQKTDMPIVHSTLQDDGLGALRGGAFIEVADAARNEGGTCSLGTLAEGTSNDTYNYFTFGTGQNDFVNADLWTDKYYVITASHCSGADSATMGTTNSSTHLYQWLPSGTSVAEKYYDAPFEYGVLGCPTGKKCRYSDAAAYTLNGSYCPWGTCSGTTYSPFGTEYRTIEPWSSSASSLTIDATNGPWQTVPTTNNTLAWRTAVGDTVYKIGGASSTVVGTVTNTCATTSQFRSDGTAIGTVIICNHIASMQDKGGDSGAGVYVRAGSNSLYIAGLSWGGTTTSDSFSDWSNLAGDLGRIGHRLRPFSYYY